MPIARDASQAHTARTSDDVLLIKSDAANPLTNVFWDNMQATQRAMDGSLYSFPQVPCPKSDRLPWTWHPPDSPRGSKRSVHGWLKIIEIHPYPSIFIHIHPYSSKVGLPRELLPAAYIARITLCALSGNAEFATKVQGSEKKGRPVRLAVAWLWPSCSKVNAVMGPFFVLSHFLQADPDPSRVCSRLWPGGCIVFGLCSQESEIEHCLSSASLGMISQQPTSSFADYHESHQDPKIPSLLHDLVCPHVLTEDVHGGEWIDCSFPYGHGSFHSRQQGAEDFGASLTDSSG